MALPFLSTSNIQSPAMYTNVDIYRTHEIYGSYMILIVKCQDIDDPSLTVKNARTSMTRIN